MRIPLSWIKEYLRLHQAPQKIAEVLTLGGMEVEKIEELPDDVVFEIGLTPNLGHCMSVLGIARELSALLNVPLSLPAPTISEDSKETLNQQISVTVEDKEKCPRYACRLVRDIAIGPSPEWLQRRLELAGMRSVNNAVDIANYVMLECGQPLHFFDYDKIRGKKILVSPGAVSMAALDGNTYETPTDALIIRDAQQPIAIAGVMGDLHSAVAENTKNILIESAYFSPTSIRKTSKAVGLRTEAAQRFEKGIDPEGVLYALDRAAELLQKCAKGRIVSGTLDTRATPYIPRQIACRIKRTNQLLGTALSLREIAEFFTRLHMQIVSEKSDTLLVQPPSYRNDLHTEIDLIEEVARLYGYNNISLRPPAHISSQLLPAPLYLFEQKLRTYMIAEGLSECVTCNLISPSLAQHTLTSGECVSVLAPRSLDQSVLRSSLLPGLLQVVKYNHDHRQRDLTLFEIGKIHFKDNRGVHEEASVGIILSGNSRPYHWDPKPGDVDFFDLKGYAENLLHACGIHQHVYEPSHLKCLHPRRQARIFLGDTALGTIGELHPTLLRQCMIDHRVFYAEFNLNALLENAKKSVHFEPLAQFPSSERDWTITLDEEVPIAPLIDAIYKMHSPYLESIVLLDLYKSEQIGKNKKNATFRFTYRDRQKTIEVETVEREHAHIIKHVEKKYEK